MLCWLLAANVAVTCQEAVGAWEQHASTKEATPSGWGVACPVGMVELVICRSFDRVMSL